MMKKTTYPRIALTGFTLAVLFGLPLVQAGIEWAGGDAPQCLDLFREPPSEAHLRSFEHDLEANSWFAAQARPVMQMAEFAALGNLGAKALAGRDGWLFYKPGVQYLIEPCHTVSDAVSAIVAFRDALEARGIHLLVIPAPGKASVYPDRLTARAERDGRPMKTHTTRLIDALCRAGIETINLPEVFASQRDSALYLVRDTHWSPEGMRLAAETTARRLLELGWVERGETGYALKSLSLARSGDVVDMVQNPWIAARFEPETIECAQVAHADTGEAYADSPDSPVLVLGDSFLRIYERDEPGSAGFIAHLARELSMPLTSIVNDGGASTLVRQELYRKPQLLAGKRVVVWEFVERDIRFGTEGWQHVPLPAGS